MIRAKNNVSDVLTRKKSIYCTNSKTGGQRKWCCYFHCQDSFCYGTKVNLDDYFVFKKCWTLSLYRDLTCSELGNICQIITVEVEQFFIIDLFNCSWTMIIAIIVNMLVFFMQIFHSTILSFSSRTFFDFSGDFFSLSFFIFEWSLLPSLWSKACC